MNLSSLPAILLALAQQRSLNDVLAAIIDAVSGQTEVALARIWLRQADAECPHCSLHSQSKEIALHLRASCGTPRSTEANWTRTNGTFHRVSLARSDLKLSYIANSGESVKIPVLSADQRWVRRPDWVAEEGLIGFAGHPIVFRGEVLGVLAVFRRSEPDDVCWQWLRVLADAAAVAIANAQAFEEVEALRRTAELERDYLREELQVVGQFGEILGSSPALVGTLRQVELVAATEAAVLIQGESGTGKELIARAIHQRSPRAAKPLVKVNCGSIPRDLFESEFFGHVRGAFTGAIRDRLGRFQLADGGTLFLDEVGEIPLELQSKLLRVLQEGEFERVGEEQTRRVSVRVVAATNRNLRQQVDDGHFRLDLFYRLGVFPVQVPPLRDRREDIPELVAHFIRTSCARFHLPEPRISHREMERAQLYSWPGNVRELQNMVERAVILAQGGSLVLEIPGQAQPRQLRQESPVEIITEQEWRNKEKANLLAALEKSQNRVSGKGGAAELLGVNPATLSSRLKALGIRPRQSGPGGGA